MTLVLCSFRDLFQQQQQEDSNNLLRTLTYKIFVLFTVKDVLGF